MGAEDPLVSPQNPQCLPTFPGSAPAPTPPAAFSLLEGVLGDPPSPSPSSPPQGFHVDVAQGHREVTAEPGREFPSPDSQLLNSQLQEIKNHRPPLQGGKKKSRSTFFNHLKPESQMEKYLKRPHQETDCPKLDKSDLLLHCHGFSSTSLRLWLNTGQSIGSSTFQKVFVGIRVQGFN